MGFGLGMSGSYGDAEAVDAAVGEAALATATEGAQRATAAGLVAHPRTVSRHGGVPGTILAEAAAEADAIVMAPAALSGVKSFLLGSVSHRVAQHADRAVLVVPSGGLRRHPRPHLRDRRTHRRGAARARRERPRP